MNSIKLKEIKIEFNEDILIKSDRSNSTGIQLRIREILDAKKPAFESAFEKLFRMVTTSVEFKLSLLYQRVKLIIEANRLIVFPYNSKNLNDPNEIFSPLAILNFDQITAGVMVKADSKKFFIMVLGSDKNFKFRTSSKEIFDNILSHLNYYVEKSLGAKSNLMGISLRKDFYKTYFIFENEFKNKAKTGDLLIFRGFECPAKCQRCFTGAHYDHVALLYKKNDILFVYESTSKDGCMLRSWREFTQFLWNLLYDKMVYRELIIDMESEEKLKYEIDLESKCEEFIKETQKKKYNLSCCAICCSRKRDYEKNNEWSKSEGFFCSQLVAAGYLKCGILKYEKGTGHYLPGTFSQNKDLHLSDNLRLGPEIIIDFSL